MRPVAGECITPWPLNPAASQNPSTSSAAPTSGRWSGVISYHPARARDGSSEVRASAGMRCTACSHSRAGKAESGVRSVGHAAYASGHARMIPDSPSGRASRRQWNPLPVSIVIGSPRGTPSKGVVQASSRRSVVTGMSTPASRATTAAHGPAAFTTWRAAISPVSVTTAVTRPPDVRMARAGAPSRSRTPRRTALEV